MKAARHADPGTLASRGEWLTTGAEETLRRGAELAAALSPGDCVALSGDLGAGKTCLIQGIAAGLGVAEVVSSPTFVLLNVYTGRRVSGRPLTVYHFDLYRLTAAEELEDIGADEFLHDPDAVSLVEWADRMPQVLPAARWNLHIDHGVDAHERRIRWRRPGEGGA